MRATRQAGQLPGGGDRCRSPIIMPACRSPIDCICRGSGSTISRRAKAHVPRAIRFKTKPQIALEQIRAALLAGVAPGVVLMDASYGSNSALRQALTELGLCYVAAIVPSVKVRPVRKDDPKPPRISVEALHSACPSTPGAPSRGGKALTRSCSRALPACALRRSGVKHGSPKRRCLPQTFSDASVAPAAFRGTGDVIYDAVVLD